MAPTKWRPSRCCAIRDVPGFDPAPVESARPGSGQTTRMDLREARARSPAGRVAGPSRRRRRSPERCGQHRGPDRDRRGQTWLPSAEHRRSGCAQRTRDRPHHRATPRSPLAGSAARRHGRSRRWAAIPGTRDRRSCSTWQRPQRWATGRLGDYATTVADEIDALVDLVGGPVGGRAELPPTLDREFFDSMFDYAAEDRYLAGGSAPSTRHRRPATRAPVGCQTVLISRNARSRAVPGALAKSGLPSVRRPA